MTTATLVFSTLNAASPYDPPPSGYTRPSAAQTGKIYGSPGVWSWWGGGSNNSVWVYDTPLAGSSVKASFKLPSPVTSNAAGSAHVDEDGDGLMIITGTSANNFRIFAIVGWQLSGSALWTNGAPIAGATVDFVKNVDGSNKTYEVFQNGVKVGTTYSNNTYTPTHGACVSRGGDLAEFSVEYTESRFITSITDPIIFGEEVTIETEGFTDPTSITAAGMTAVIDSFEDGVIAATWPALDEGLVCTVPLPATNVELTVSESGGSASVNVDFPLTNEYPEFVEFDNINTGGRYIGGKITLEEGWRSYYDNTQLGGMEIHPDSGVTCTDAGTFTMLLHRVGNENDMVKYFITVNEHGDVTNVKGLSVSGVSAKGLSMKGLAIKGLRWSGCVER